MSEIDVQVGNNAKNILPVPLPSPPVPNVESPVNYGSSPYPMPLKPSSRKDDDLQYCNFLEPSPRDQRLNTPYEGKKNCPKFDAQPYKKDSCYLYNSKAQGVTGIVCNQSGGSDNANFVRGGQFGVDYPPIKKKNMEYVVEKPVQIPLELENPMVMYDQSTFYPEKNFFLRKNPNYLTYPLQNNYTEAGIPTYRYPYKVMNPIYGNQVKAEMPPSLASLAEIKEKYTDYQPQNKEKIFMFMILFVLIVFLILHFVRL